MKHVSGALAAIALLHASAASAANWTNKTITQLQPDHYSADCYYFTLQGVTEADPVRPGNPWFAVERTTHPGSKDLFATLLAARISDRPVTVVTTGAVVCGYAGVSYVLL